MREHSSFVGCQEGTPRAAKSEGGEQGACDTATPRGRPADMLGDATTFLPATPPTQNREAYSTPPTTVLRLFTYTRQ
jgi:hypothetical protein